MTLTKKNNRRKEIQSVEHNVKVYTCRFVVQSITRICRRKAEDKLTEQAKTAMWFKIEKCDKIPILHININHWFANWYFGQFKASPRNILFD